MSKKTGYDRFLEYQFRQSGSFVQKLFGVIFQADTNNIEKLRLGFPEEVDAVLTWQLVGREALLAKVSPDHPLRKDVEEGRREL